MSPVGGKKARKSGQGWTGGLLPDGPGDGCSPIDVALIALVAYVQLRAVPAIEQGDIHRYGGEITLVSLGLCLLIVVIALLSMKGERQ